MNTGLIPIFLKTGERDVLNRIMQGLTDKQIAHDINMSISCVTSRKKRLFERFEVGSKQELIDKYNAYLAKIKEIDRLSKILSKGNQ